MHGGLVALCDLILFLSRIYRDGFFVFVVTQQSKCRIGSTHNHELETRERAIRSMYVQLN
jgi:hypothetical protein